MENKTDPKELIKQAMEAKKRAYCPYSNFPVGAALLCDDDTIVTGCNVENVSFGLTICAERVALTKAVSEGRRKFKAIALSTNEDKYITPCGACRQFCCEFCAELDVYLISKDGNYRKDSLKALLPDVFCPAIDHKPDQLPSS